MKILVVGDTHAEWAPFNRLINRQRPDIVLQVGDYGWWPHCHKKERLGRRRKLFNQYGVRNHQDGLKTKIYWCPGNHENWDSLDELGHDPVEVQEDIWYMPFGSLLELPDGRTVMFVGGANSIDASSRKEGYSWWRQEVISQEEMDRLPETEVDIIISHTVPRDWLYANPCLVNGYIQSEAYAKYRDPSTFALQLIRERYQPKRWISGHFHYSLDAEIDGCLWTSLNCTYSNDRWWIELEDI